MPNEGERLQKVMAWAGVASRRRCEDLIRAGRVRVNGVVVTDPALRVHLEQDRIEVDGRILDLSPSFHYYMLYKPRGYLSTVRDPHADRTVMELVPQRPRLYPVGRLDKDSEGLLLFTNDGELTYRLLHPRYGHEKEYRVLIRGELAPAQIAQLEQGLILEGKARPAHAIFKPLGEGWAWRGEPLPKGARWIGLVLREGHKRQIREMFKHLGIPVLRLIRVRMGNLTLGNLNPGEGRFLTEEEVAALRRLVGLDT